MKKLPIFLSLEGKRVLLVGGGRAAEIKLQTLLETGCDCSVVSERYSIGMQAMLEKEQVPYVVRKFTEQDLKGIFLVFAVAEPSINDRVYEMAANFGILCCKADGQGDFIVPAHRRQGDLTVAVSTDGKFPLLGKKICKESNLSWGKQLEVLAEKRRKILQSGKTKQEQKRALEQLLEEFCNETKD